MSACSTPFALMYHSVARTEPDAENQPTTVSPEQFDAQMSWLRDRGLRGVSMHDLLLAADNEAAAGLVGLTFDDGYADFATHALPVLRRYGFGATVYVLAGKMGGRNDWSPHGPQKTLLTEDEVYDLAHAGIEIGSHGLGHVHLDETNQSLMWLELAKSKAILESVVSAPVRGFCYPYGEVSTATMAAAAAHGYDYAVTTWPSARRHRHALPRTHVGPRDHGPRLRAKQLRHRLTWGAHR